MLLISMMVHSSVFRFFALILGITFLMSFGENRCVLARIRLGPDERYPAKPGVPDVSDYPSFEDIEKNYQGTPKMGTLVMAISQLYRQQYFKFCEGGQYRKTCIYRAYPEGFMVQGERSSRFYAQFYDDCNSVLSCRCLGTCLCCY